MRRIVPLLAAAACLASNAGCGGAGWYQAIGHLPGNAYTDYAYYDFCGTSSQLYPLPVPVVEGAAVEAMGDLGYKLGKPPERQPGGGSVLHGSAPDGRPATITLTPQNSLTNVRINIGPCKVGDVDTSRELFRRIGMNMGTAIRAINPIDATVPKRFNIANGIPPRTPVDQPFTLEGDGLRPDQSRDKPVKTEEPEAQNDDEDEEGAVPNFLRNTVPTRDNPNPGMPYAPFPYTPF
jgi:hypothetical protein